MKRHPNHSAVLFLALAAFLAVAALAALPGQSQGGGPPASLPPNVKTTAAVRERHAAAPTGSSPFVAAAERNAALREQLPWTFGGKPQRGWQLYVPLIGVMLDTEDGPQTPRFAESLARWQRTSGLAPSGVLDEETLYRMVSAWQAARIKDRAYPSPDQLVTAPPTDFYDPERPEELRQVEAKAYAAYKRLVAAACADPSLRLARSPDGGLAPSEKYLKIISSFRSKAYQERLRQQSPQSGRAGLAVNSPHFTGRALDLYVGGDPVETKDSNRALQTETPVYRWLVRNAHRFGFRPYYYEPWHWEYTGQ